MRLTLRYVRITLENINLSEITNVVIYMQSDPSYVVGDSLVTNYLVNINTTTNANLNFDEYNNLTKELKNFWLVCC